MRPSAAVRRIALLAALFAAARASAAGLSVDVSETNVMPGDDVVVSVTYSGKNKADAAPVFEFPDAAALAGPSTQSSFQSINGVTSQSVSWTYRATPVSSGVIRLGKVSVAIGGETLSAAVPEITVGEPPPQPYVKLRLSSDKSEVLLDETFTVTVELDALVPVIGERPVQPWHPELSSQLVIDWLEPSEDSAALPDADLNELLSGCRADTGFSLNNISEAPSIMSFGFNRRALTFAFSPVEKETDGLRYQHHELRIPFRAEKEGDAVFTPVRFRGYVATTNNGDLVRSPRIAALSERIAVKIVPPPLANRPASFFGGLGTTLSADVSIDATSCRQGDPLTLSIDLRGDLVERALKTPDIFASESLSGILRPYGEPERSMNDGHPRFSWHVRPVAAGTLEIPPIELSFFNTATRAYETVSTAPVPLRVEAMPDIDLDSLFATDSETETAAPKARSVSALEWAHAPSPAPRFAPAAFAVPPAVCLFALAFAALWRRRHAVAAALRSGLSGGRAIARLEAAATPQDALDAIRRAIRDRGGEDIPGLMPGDVRDALARHGADPETAARLATELQNAFDESFRPGVDAKAEFARRRPAIVALFRKCGFILLLAASCAFAGGADEFEWRSLNAAAAKARTQEEFSAVADRASELLQKAPDDGALARNAASIMLMAGRNTEALVALRAAEAKDGATPETENNLLVALGDNAELPWQRAVLRPHYALPLATRVDALFAAWALLCVALTLCAFKATRRRAIPFAVAAFIATAAFASSVAASRRAIQSVPDALRAAAAVETEAGE